MIQVRRGAERGHFDLGWLQTYHSFSFGDYHDSAHMGFRNLRVINEDHVQPGMGFPTHGHRDMEIVTFVLSGELKHKDSLGTGSVIRPGDVQRMSAGKGVLHSEFNASTSEPVHLLQIWILPRQAGGEPAYEQRSFAPDLRQDRLAVLASPDGREGSVTLQADALIGAATLSPTATLEHELGLRRHAWIQVTDGQLELAGEQLEAGDAAAISDEPHLQLQAGSQGTTFLLFDCPRIAATAGGWDG